VRLLIVVLFVLSGSLKAYSATDSSSGFPPGLSEQQIEQLEQAQKSVWEISNNHGEGTAFFVSPRHIVTNLHVILAIFAQDVSSFSLQREGNERGLSVKRLVSVSGFHDLALLETERDSAFHLKVRKDFVSNKEKLVLLGYPQGGFRWTLNTSPLRSFKDDIFTYFFVNHTDLEGNSGGPVLDANNKVVGVASKEHDHYMGMIKGSVLRKFIAGDIGLRCEGRDPKACIKEDLNDLQKQAERGNQIAQSQLATHYNEVQQDFPSAFHWFRRSAEQGGASAQYNLGVMYYEGEGVQQDFPSAFHWFRRSAEQGHAHAQYNLGVMYYKGEGTQQDFPSAFHWFCRSAEQGGASAQYNLGVMYYEGEGVQQDFPLAFHWFCRSAEQGGASAQYNLGVMLGGHSSSSCHKVFE